MENRLNEVITFEKQLDEKKVREKERKINRLKILAIPTLLYAVFSTFCLYRNFNGITMILFAIATIVYTQFVLKKQCIEIKKGINFYSAAIILFAISDVLTDNGVIVFFNNVAIFVLIVFMLLYTAFSQKDWSIAQYIDSFFSAFGNAIGGISDAVGDILLYISEGKNQKTRTSFYCFIGVLIFIPMAFILVPLLSMADAVFGSLIKDFWNKLWSIENLIMIPIYFLGIYTFTYGGMKWLGEKKIAEANRKENLWSQVIADTILLLVDMLYLFFSLIQIFSLFLGKMQLPVGYTYARYAREGFFELLIVCFINLCIIVFTKEHFEVSLYTKILLCLECICTYIMLASSAIRLYLYIKMYNLTVLRVEAWFGLVVVGVCMAIIMINVFTDSFNLMHALATVVVIGMLALSFAKPDAIVAKYNLTHINSKTDYYYLTSLSTDAAPYMKGLQEEPYLSSYRYECAEYTDNFRTFNVSRYIAYRLATQK